MITMPIRKAGRSAISIVAVATLLLCQAAWAGTRAPERLMAAMGQVSGSTAAAGCHDLGGGDMPEHAVPSPCESAQLPSGDIKLAVFVPAALDLLFLLQAPSAPEPALLAIQPAHLAGVPPPLRLLHCRFRN
jgi:hypothetical protein